MAGPCQQSGRAMPALEVADKGLVEGVLPTLPSTRVNRRAVERLVPAWEAPEKKKLALFLPWSSTQAGQGNQWGRRP